MNKKNLQIMYDWLYANQEMIEPKFNMSIYRLTDSDFYNHICGTQGCLIGWGVGAFPYEELPKYKYDKSIQFNRFSEEILEIDISSRIWDFMFSERWSRINNTLEHALGRIKHVLDGKELTDHPDIERF